MTVHGNLGFKNLPIDWPFCPKNTIQISGHTVAIIHNIGAEDLILSIQSFIYKEITILNNFQ